MVQVPGLSRSVTAITMSARSPARGGASSQLDSPRSASTVRLATPPTATNTASTPACSCSTSSSAAGPCVTVTTRYAYGSSGGRARDQKSLSGGIGSAGVQRVDQVPEPGQPGGQVRGDRGGGRVGDQRAQRGEGGLHRRQPLGQLGREVPA